MKHPPTDLQLLEAIYRRYYDVFINHSPAAPTRGTKAMVPIDIPAIANEFKVDVDIVFGLLYYHLDHKYRYSEGDASVRLFVKQAGADRDCVHFPYLSSILSELRNEEQKYQTATWLAGLSLIVSIVALYVSLFFGKG